MRLLTRGALLLIAALGCGQSIANERVDAVWREQRLDFAYRGGATTYTCRDLAERVATVLRAVAVQSGVTAGHLCTDFAYRQRLTVALRAPEAATREYVQEALATDATRRLLAHVRGESIPTEADLERFPAVWRRVSLAKQSHLRLGPGDCELLRDIADQLFSRLSVRFRRSNLNCASPSSHIALRLEVEALLPWEQHTHGGEPRTHLTAKDP
jgi:hypothetical protein